MKRTVLALLCALGVHLQRELRLEPDTDVDEPLFIPWWICPCGDRTLF